jgi:quercetin dioxygenase-like cupin family protein
VEIFELEALRWAKEGMDRLYYEFLRKDSLSMGLYVLPAGATDPQSPHTEDEVYYVVSGRGRFRAGPDDQEVQAGSIIYVAANVEHRFHDVSEELAILVFFSPAEYSASPKR